MSRNSVLSGISTLSRHIDIETKIYQDTPICQDSRHSDLVRHSNLSRQKLHCTDTLHLHRQNNKYLLQITNCLVQITYCLFPITNCKLQITTSIPFQSHLNSHKLDSIVLHSCLYISTYHIT